MSALRVTTRAKHSMFKAKPPNFRIFFLKELLLSVINISTILSLTMIIKH